MKAIQTILVALLFTVPCAPASAQAEAAHQATGVVISVDRAKSAAMLAHDPVNSLNWPAMTMEFKVKDPALLRGVETGARISFEFAEESPGVWVLNRRALLGGATGRAEETAGHGAHSGH